MTWRPTEATLFLEKTVTPTVNDDQNEGYLVGDIWIDQTNDLAYLNLDVTVGAAVWKHISLEEAATNYALLADLAAEGGADLIGHHTVDTVVHTVKNMFEHITPSWLMSGGVISDTGGLNIQWAAGAVFDESNGTVYEFNARGTDLALTDGSNNYLYWNGTTRSTTLAVATSRPAHPNVTIGHAHCQDGDIWGMHQNYYAGRNAREYWLGLRSVFPSIITSGLVVSEDVDVTNALDVVQTAGVYYEAVHDRVVGAEILSRTAPLMKRWFHNSGVWDHSDNAQIDTAQYDNGTDLVNIPANKYVKTVFFTDGTYIHWVYATETFVKKSDALAANTPTLPPGLLHLPKTTALVYQEGDTVLPTDVDNWIDVRPTISPAEGAGIVTSHLNLTDIGIITHADVDTHIGDGTKHFLEGAIDHGSIAGLGDSADHAWALLIDGSRAMTGELKLGTTPAAGNRLTSYGRIEISGDNSIIWNNTHIYLNDADSGEAYAFGNRGAYFSFSSETSPHNAIRLRFRAADGYVSIGTADPEAKLDVDGDLILQSGTSVNEFSTDVTLAGDSNDAVPTEKAVKAYVDNKVKSGCRVYRNSAQSIPDATWTKVQFNTEDYDSLNEYDNTTNYRFTATKAGIYIVSSSVHLLNMDSSSRISMSINKNGSGYIRGIDYSTSIVAHTSPHVSVPVKLAATDYIEIMVYQDSSGAKNTASGVDLVSMIVQRVA